MKRPLATLGIAAGWLLFVILGVRLVEVGFGFFEKQQEALAQTQEHLMRLKGWLLVEAQVTKRREEVLGPFARVPGGDWSWVTLQGLEQVAKEQSLTVTDLRPSELAGRGLTPTLLRLDAKLEGELAQISGMLRRLPEVMPGVKIESLQLMPQEGNRIQALVRLSLPELAR